MFVWATWSHLLVSALFLGNCHNERLCWTTAPKMHLSQTALRCWGGENEQKEVTDETSSWRRAQRNESSVEPAGRRSRKPDELVFVWTVQFSVRPTRTHSHIWTGINSLPRPWSSRVVFPVKGQNWQLMENMSVEISKHSENEKKKKKIQKIQMLNWNLRKNIFLSFWEEISTFFKVSGFRGKKIKRFLAIPR